jgi:tetratricopeptide (TPR) repeat protein
MTDERFERLCEIIRRALEAPPELREALIRDACGDDTSLAADVHAAIAPDPAIAAMLKIADPETTPDPLIGRDFHGFRIESCLGYGGMGAVYRATQLSTNGTVALKFIHPHHLTLPFGTGGRRRFDAEIRTLAKLEHPGIAKVHSAWVIDLGAGPRPFFAMELVDGQPIDRYVRESDLPPSEIARLVADAADAIGHAHLRGVIHRDIKPQNILVDRERRARIIDFGIARAIDPGDSAPRLTAAGQTLQPIGTLRYMSPEQLNAPDDLDIRTDVYSLGVVAYELLAGRPPLDLDGLAPAAVAAALAEKEPAKLRTIDSRLEPDLETVVGMALEKDRTRRYASATEFAADLRRVLRHEPVLARPPTRVYLARKFVRRNPGLTGGIAAAVFGLTLGAGLAESQRQKAEQSAAANLALRWGTFDAVTGIAHFAISPLMPLSEEATKDAIRARVTAMLAVVESPHAYEQFAQRQLQSSDAYVETKGAIYRTVGNAYEQLNDLPAAEGIYRELLEFRRRSNGSESPDAAAAAASLALVIVKSGRVEESAQLLDQALPILLAQSDPGWQLEAASTIDNVALVQRKQGRFREAERSYRQELDLRTRLDGPDSLDTARAEQNLALVLIDDDRAGEAEPLLRRQLALFERDIGKESAEVAFVLRSLGLALRELGRAEEGIPLLRRGLQIVAQTMGKEAPVGCAIRVYLAGCLLDTAPADSVKPDGRLDEARTLLQEVLAPLDASGDSQALLRAEARAELARALFQTGASTEAKPLLQAASDLAAASPHPKRLDRRLEATRSELASAPESGE